MIKQLTTMLELQDAMNSKVHAQWRDNGNEWYRAIWVECAELLDHYGWKWWKAQTPDVEQVELELIDIWHFGLSIELEKGLAVEKIAQQLASELVQGSRSDDFRAAVEAFALATLSTKQFDVRGFAGLLGGCGMSFDDLYRRYVGKNVLNFFRQDNGYKDGTYKKVWQGKEDNEHLVEILDELSPDSASFREDLYSSLSARYQSA